MFCKATPAVFAAISLSVGACLPGQAADLHGRHGYPGGWSPPIHHGVPVSYGYGLCYQRELLPTPWGPRWRLVNRC
jgi:hypothetical protein